MSELEKFEKRFQNAWFSSGWVEVDSKSIEEKPLKKDLTMLQSELEEINTQLESVNLKKLRLSNLAKFYAE